MKAKLTLEQRFTFYILKGYSAVRSGNKLSPIVMTDVLLEQRQLEKILRLVRLHELNGGANFRVYD